MPDFLLELLSEEIPARMQARARADLQRLLEAELAAAGLRAETIATYATPRRLALIARNLPDRTAPTREERKGPRADAPEAAIAGFLRSTGLRRDQLEERADKKGASLFAILEQPGRATIDVLAEAIPAIVRGFPWPKSMRWGAASVTADSPRWVRPLQGIVALFGNDVVPCEVAGIRSGAATVGHRFHHPGLITIGGADDYLAKLNACQVIVDQAERARLIRNGARGLAAEAGLTLVEDEGLVEENAGLTEWPMPLLGRFDPAFLDVPPEVIRLTMRANQKYFALTQSSPAFAGEVAARSADGGARSEAEGSSAGFAAGPSTAGSAGDPPPPARLGEDHLAPAFICTANIDPSDGGARIVAGNQKVLAARLADARYFWEADLRVPLDDQAAKLGQIVFHEKLGTLADKVERVAKLARWLVEEGIVTSKSSPALAGEGDHARHGGGARSEAEGTSAGRTAPDGRGPSTTASGGRPPPRAELGEDLSLAALAERAARLCKADLVTKMVGEFPELQGIIGGHLAAAQGEDPQVAAAIRDHYKPVGQGDEVPTAPVTVSVSLADKLDTIAAFWVAGTLPTGSKDPFGLRRATLSIVDLVTENRNRVPLQCVLSHAMRATARKLSYDEIASSSQLAGIILRAGTTFVDEIAGAREVADAEIRAVHEAALQQAVDEVAEEKVQRALATLLHFFADRLKVQQREAGVRHDLIDAVFALGGEDDLVRLLARVRALQAFVETPEGADLLAGYKRAANILKKEGWPGSPDRHPGLDPGSTFACDDPSKGGWMPDQVRHDEPSGPRESRSYTPPTEETALLAALDSAERRAADAVVREDFEGAMAALATLRVPVDAFFDEVTVNDPDPAKREARLVLLARIRNAIHQVADFSKIEG